MDGNCGTDDGVCVRGVNDDISGVVRGINEVISPATRRVEKGGEIKINEVLSRERRCGCGVGYEEHLGDVNDRSR